MKILFTKSILLLWAISLSAQYKNKTPLKLWYEKPAKIWVEALALGNGKTGSMAFGGINSEHFQLNDNTLWSGFPEPGNNANGQKLLPLLREAIFNDDATKANQIWKKMQGPYSARYLPLGDLHIEYGFKDSTVSAYYRDLDIENAVSNVSFKLGEVTYKRESFISYPDRVMVIKLTADQKRAMNINISMSSLLKYVVNTSNNDLRLIGKAPKHVAHRNSEPKQIVYDEKEGMNFEALLKVLTTDGKTENFEKGLTIVGASEIVLLLSTATSYNGYDKSPGLEGKDPSIENSQNISLASKKTFDQLKSAHIKDYRRLYTRVSFNLGNDGEYNQATTNRLNNFKTNKSDLGLHVLYYQFGRYLMIASSRHNGLATNLQGIWNNLIQPAWGSNYTVNVNTQMNYWLAENTNLSECHEPLFDFISHLSKNGAVTAKVNYGIDQGWVVHHNSDIWAKTSPAGGYEWDPMGMPRFACWPMAGAWLSTHLYEHYLYTNDKAFLRRKGYPLMKGAAQFMLKWLVTDPKSGYLVTNPSTSPENVIKIDGKQSELTVASTMDMSIIRELFQNCIDAAKALKTDRHFAVTLAKTRAKLYPYHIGRYGQLQEWFQDWDNPKDTHRHISQLYGLYPGHQIDVYKQNALANAAKTSLIQRGDFSTGWSMAWKINWWARLQDGDHAYRMVCSGLNMISPDKDGIDYGTGGGGVYPNLFDAHPPFQIDGNFGATAGITEMLVQSQHKEIFLLPALPTAWKDGSIKGVMARGGYQICEEWKNNKLLTAEIKAVTGSGKCRIRTFNPIRIKGVIARSQKYLLPKITNKSISKDKLQLKDSYLTEFIAVKGKNYQIIGL